MRRVLLLLFLFVTVFSLTGFADKSATPPGSTTLTGWMDLHCRLVRASTGITHVAYSRHFSYTAIAAYESIVSSDRSFRSLSGQLVGLQRLPMVPPKSLYSQASLNAAYADMLRSFYGRFGACQKSIDSMERANQQGFVQAGIVPSLLEKSRKFGKSTATAILRWASGDGATSMKEYIPLKGEGVWVPASQASAPFWHENRSLTPNLRSAFSLQHPTYSTDTANSFWKMANEVYNVSASLTAEQKATARYWDDSPNGQYMTVFGHWTSILSELLKQHQLPLIKACEAYAKMTITMHEAALLAWQGKYSYNVVRPITFIQQHINSGWMPLITTPAHPEFPAAHATLSNAAATALCSLFGNDCKVTDKSYTDIGMAQRNYLSLQEVAQEAGLSRLYGGIHYRYSIEQGFILGEATARHIDRSIRFQPPKFSRVEATKMQSS